MKPEIKLSPDTIALIEKKAKAWFDSYPMRVQFNKIATMILTDESILASIKGDGWVSVEERLPENGGWCNDTVLFIRKTGEILIGNYDYEHSEWTDTSGDRGFGFKEVTHWQPLPTPPKQ